MFRAVLALALSDGAIASNPADGDEFKRKRGTGDRNRCNDHPMMAKRIGTPSAAIAGLQPACRLVHAGSALLCEHPPHQGAHGVARLASSRVGNRRQTAYDWSGRSRWERSTGACFPPLWQRRGLPVSTSASPATTTHLSHQQRGCASPRSAACLCGAATYVWRGPDAG